MPPARYANTPIIQTSNSFPHKCRRANRVLKALTGDEEVVITFVRIQVWNRGMREGIAKSQEWAAIA